MLKIREAIVVEGRYDKNTLSQLVDTVILETSGFGIFKDRETLALLRKIILLIPLIYLLPAVLPLEKTTAVFLAEPVADTLAVATTASLFFVQFRRAMKGLETAGTVEEEP